MDREGLDALTCRELVDLVTDHLEGALPPAARLRVELHLAECPGCTAYLGQMRDTVLALGLLPADAIEPEAWAALLPAFRRWRAGLTPPEGPAPR